MQNQQEPSLLQQLREGLKPKGTKGGVVRIHMTGYFDEAFVQKALGELENKASMVAAGLDEWSAMDKLVLELLQESAEL